MNSLIDENNKENDYLNSKNIYNPSQKNFEFMNNSPQNEAEYLQSNFSLKNDSEKNDYYSNHTLLNKDVYRTISPENKSQNFNTGINFFNNISSSKSNFLNNNTSANFFNSSNNLNNIQFSTVEKQSNHNLINISNIENSDLNHNTLTANRNITTKNQTNKSIVPKNIKKQIQDKISLFCTDTSNKALALKNIIENYTAINKKIFKTRKQIDQKFLKPDLEQEIKKDNKEFKRSKGFFIYPKSLLNPVYVSENDKNVFLESNYVDKLNENKAFAARNLIFNKYKVYINNKDLYNYKSDIRPDKTHDDYIEIFKKNKIRKDSFNIKKLIFNTKVIQKEINDKFEEMKTAKIVSNILNKIIS